MTLATLLLFYRRAATLTRAYSAAYARTSGLDAATSRRVRLDLPAEEPGRSRRACGARAARVTMDRACAAAAARRHALDQLLYDPYEEAIARGMLEAAARRAPAN